MFNIAQLATWEQAREYAAKLSAGPIVVGRGVSPETVDPNTSGIFSPEWLTVPGAPEPYYHDQETGKNYYPLHFRFRNGAAGMNVGLIIGMFKRLPNSPLYVLSALAAEANSLATD